jgi:hypothetical protein
MLENAFGSVVEMDCCGGTAGVVTQARIKSNIRKLVI